jgi:enterochelin esterase family protein
MIFQDGWYNLDPEGEVRAGIVLDNLIHESSMPVTVGIFVEPGEPGNRNIEYDPPDARYATFLIEAILPEVARRVAITSDPELTAIAGGSSGGNCAFTAAWHRPDRFRRVMSFVGSFAQTPGGNVYPELIQTEERRPLRIFLQASHYDLSWNGAEYNWFSNNLKVAAALAERGYDLRIVVGDGGHSPNHGGALLPDALRWLWR